MARLIGHLLLALCLVLNGIGGAAMATAMPVAHAMADSSSLSERTDNDCHDQVASSSPTADDRSVLPAPVDSDCCDPKRCDGACAQYAVAVTEVLANIGTDDLGLGYRVAAPSNHVDPVLGRAVRPPIA